MIIYEEAYEGFGPHMPEWIIPVIIILALWTIFWKGVSMWHAARKNDSTWFVILLIFNTLGILEMFYLFGVAKIKKDKLLKK